MDGILPSYLPSGLGNRENTFRQKILQNLIYAEHGTRIPPPTKNVGYQLLLVRQPAPSSRNGPRMEGGAV